MSDETTIRRKIVLGALLVSIISPTSASAQGKNNFEGRRPVIVNNAPHVELSSFTFENEYQDRAFRFTQNITWKNISSQPVVAFEIVILKYDPFDRRLLGSRWLVTGKNSADWSPLQPGESDSDGTRALGSEEVLTAIAYVRHVRLADGTIWTADDAELLAAIRKAAPGIREFGDVKPDSVRSGG